MENSKKLMELALQLEAPWYIKQVDFTPIGKTRGRLDIYLDFKTGAKFPDESGGLCPVHDTKEKTWRHLDFFQHDCYLHARVPRIRTAGKVRLIAVPWARPESGFTLLFEAFAMALIECEMPVARAAGTLRIQAPRLWRIFSYWVGRALGEKELSGITKIGMDETSFKRGHEYVTLSVDLDKRRVVHVVPGKDETTVAQLRNHLETKGISPDEISHFSIDMSPALIGGIRKAFPQSAVVFDRFHIKKLLNERMDRLRKLERREHEELKGLKYVFLKKQKDLKDAEKHAKFEMMELFPKLGEGVRLVELFDDFYAFNDKEQAAAFLAWWCDQVEDSGIFPFRKFINTVRAHWSGIVNWYDDKISNGTLEGINSKIQLAKKRARGFRNIENFINMIYFIAGDLDFNYPIKTL